MRRFKYAMAGICIISIILMSGCTQQSAKSAGKGLFSWKKSAVLQERTQLLAIMREQEINNLYQAFSSDLTQGEIKGFLAEAKKASVAVYWLGGSPEWALDNTGKEMCEAISKAIKIKRYAGQENSLKGVILDVEPYLLEEWEDGAQEAIIDSFLEGIRSAYELAKSNKLEFLVCIPYYYDTKGLDRQLETLIRSSCDGIAVMNYYRDKERIHIQTEAEMTAKYHKKLISVYEFQPPGKHGLAEKNTYYNLGIKEAEKNFADLQSAYRDQGIAMGLHDYTAFKKAAGYE